MDTDELIAPDLILLLLAAPTNWQQATNRINGITRLEKLLFLIDKECPNLHPLANAFEFIPYHYGPYSKEIYEAVELLEEAGLLEEHRKINDPELDWAEELLYSDMTTEISYERQFILTDDGKSVADYLSHSHPHLQPQLSKIKDRYAGLTLHDLIFHVYTDYPASTEKSVIRDKIVGPSPG